MCLRYSVYGLKKYGVETPAIAIDILAIGQTRLRCLIVCSYSYAGDSGLCVASDTQLASPVCKVNDNENRASVVGCTILRAILPVLLFQPNYRLAHPENNLFSLSNKIFSGSEYPKNSLYIILKKEALEITIIVIIILCTILGGAWSIRAKNSTGLHVE